MTSVRTPNRIPDWSPHSDRSPDLTRPDLTRPDPSCISPLRDDNSFPCLNYRPRARAFCKSAMEEMDERMTARALPRPTPTEPTEEAR